MPFQKASKKQAKLRLALIGPAGSGKTYTALAIATNLGQRVAVIDTERGSASKYADIFAFDVLELDSFHPQKYIDAIHEAEAAGYDVLIIDSLSHAWMGKDGALELVDKASKRAGNGNSFGAWREVTPLHNKLVDTMIGARLHLIATMRSKMEYVQEKDDKGKTVIRKVGLQPVQRDGLEYEFDVVGDLDQDNTLVISKTRCPALNEAVLAKPGKDVANVLVRWLSDGTAPMQSVAAPTEQEVAPSTDMQPAPQPEPVSILQAKLLNTAKEMGLTMDQLRSLWKSVTGKDTMKGAKADDFQAALDMLQAHSSVESEAAQSSEPAASDAAQAAIAFPS